MQKLTRGKVSLVGAGVVIALLALLLASNVFTTGRGNVHAAPSSKQPSLFALEHQHGKVSSSPVSSAFAYTCSGATSGNLLINVTEHIANDADSGQMGNYWAIDTLTRTIKVWNVGDDSYCGVETYNGTFVAQAGQLSPGSTSSSSFTLTGDEGGTIKGAAQVFITGQLNVSNPAVWPLSGKVNGGNAVDYGCTINPDGSDTCTNYVDWLAQYFDENASGYTLSEDNWGFRYVGTDQPPAADAGKAAGVWVNASTGNHGDIFDQD